MFLVSPRNTAGTNLKYGLNSADGALNTITLPDNTAATNYRPCWLQYRKTAYCLGYYSINLTTNRYLQSYAMGIMAPVSAPVLAASAGPGPSAEECYGYVTYVHKVGQMVLQESAPSPPSNIIALTNQARAWTALPTTAPDKRVTHIRLYAAVNGGDARMAVERDLGVSTVTENVATLALAQVIQFNRLVFPKMVIGKIYHDRLFGVDQHDRTKLRYSELFEPESYGPYNSFTTRDGEFITGLALHDDTLLVFCRNCTYALTGWGTAESSFTFRKIHPTIGCISHFAIVNINGRTWFPSQEGVFAYDGSFRPMMKKLMTYFRDDYLAHTQVYEQSAAVDDRYQHIYKLLIPFGYVTYPGVINTTGSFYYVGHYSAVEPELDGHADQPGWTFDFRARTDFSIGTIRNVNSNRDEVYTGSCDGAIRKENDEDDPDDNGDSYLKHYEVRLKHSLMDDPGGDIREGKTFVKFWTYTESEFNPWKLTLIGGDEHAGDAVPLWTDDVAASRRTGPGGAVFTAQTVHVHVPEKVTGRGFTAIISADAPIRMKFRGIGGIWGPGPATRPIMAAPE